MNRVQVGQEVRKGKKSPEVLIDSLGGERCALKKLLKPVKDRLAIKPKMTWAPNVVGPQESLPSSEQFGAGSRLDDAREALSTDGPEVVGVGKNEGPAGLSKVRMGSRVT